MPLYGFIKGLLMTGCDEKFRFLIAMIPGKGMLSIQHVLLGRGERPMEPVWVEQAGKKNVEVSKFHMFLGACLKAISSWISTTSPARLLLRAQPRGEAESTESIPLQTQREEDKEKNWGIFWK